jgi:hypothetical protein
MKDHALHFFLEQIVADYKPRDVTRAASLAASSSTRQPIAAVPAGKA